MSGAFTKWKNNTTLDNLFHTIVKWYAAIIVIYQALWTLVPIRWAAACIGLHKLLPLLAPIGTLLILVDLLKDRIVFKSKYWFLLVASLGLMVISSLLYYRYGVSENLKVIIWQANQMLLLYSLYIRIGIADFKRLFKLIFNIIPWALTAGVLVSLYQYVFAISYRCELGNTSFRQGLQEGRLFGVFTSVHYATVLILLTSIVLLYFLFKTQSRVAKTVYILQIALFFIYIVLSGTRSVLVALLCGDVVGSILLVVRYVKSKNISLRFPKMFLYNASVAIASVLCILVLYNGTKSMSVSFYQFIHQDSQIGTGDGNEENEENDVPILDREDVNSGDVSNHRFQIWRDYFNCVSSQATSVIFGMTPGNYMKIIYEEFPDTYIVQYIVDNYPNMILEGRIYDTHNAYLNLYVSTGILGVLVIGLFIILSIKDALVYLVRSPKISSFFIMVSICLIIIGVASFFDTDLFFKCSSASLLFWLFCGLLQGEIGKSPCTAE